MTYEQARAELFKLHGVEPNGAGRRQWGLFTNATRGYTAGGQVKPDSQRPGTTGVQYGVAPTEAQVQAFYQAMGGGRGSSRGRVRSRRDNAAGQPPAASSSPAQSQYADILSRLAAAEQSKVDEANAANEARFARIDQSKTDLSRRVAGKVDNWGKVQSQLNAEAAQRQIDQAKADAADRGLANSNVVPARTDQINRNLALVQQDLSERKSAREIGYDMDLTRDQDAFVERKYDNAPDDRGLMELYAKLGEAQAYERGRQEAGASRPQPTRQRRRQAAIPGSGVSPLYAAMLGASLQGAFPFAGMSPGQAAGSVVAGSAPYMYPSWTSNAYPKKRTPEDYAAIAAGRADDAPAGPTAGPGAAAAAQATLMRRRRRLPDWWKGDLEDLQGLDPNYHPDLGPVYRIPDWQR